MGELAPNGTDAVATDEHFIQEEDVEAQTRGTGLKLTESAFQARSPLGFLPSFHLRSNVVNS